MRMRKSWKKVIEIKCLHNSSEVEIDHAEIAAICEIIMTKNPGKLPRKIVQMWEQESIILLDPDDMATEFPQISNTPEEAKKTLRELKEAGDQFANPNEVAALHAQKRAYPELSE
jgi:mRNA degradation ribonuclease J1/J2